MANPTPDPVYLTPIEPTFNEGRKWACVSAQLLLAINNLGIVLDMSNPYNNPIQPTDNEGLKWAKIGAQLVALAGGVSGSLSGQSGVADVTNGTNGGTITFGTAFTATPVVTMTLIKPGSGSGNLTLTGYTVTTAGISYALSANVPSTGYQINWIAEGA